jgi:hypothetical protein
VAERHINGSEIKSGVLGVIPTKFVWWRVGTPPNQTWTFPRKVLADLATGTETR